MAVTTVVAGKKVAAPAAVDTEIAAAVVAAGSAGAAGAEIVEAALVEALGGGTAGSVPGVEIEVEDEELRTVLGCKRSRVRPSQLSGCAARESMSGDDRVKLGARRSEIAQRPVHQCPSERVKCWQVPRP